MSRQICNREGEECVLTDRDKGRCTYGWRQREVYVRIETKGGVRTDREKGRCTYG
jgi:hypothetical protein